MAFGLNHGSDDDRDDDSAYPVADAFEQEAWDHSPFDELEEMDLAAEVLGVTDEAELENTLKKLIQRSGDGVGSFVHSPTGRALGSILKGAARKALPMIGSSIGSAVAGRGGAGVGKRLAVEAGRIFGLELEGLSPEDQEFEAARRFVRFAGAAAQNAARLSSRKSPAGIAKDATIASALRLAPGLIRKVPDDHAMPNAERTGRGRWRRLESNIIVENVF